MKKINIKKDDRLIICKDLCLGYDGKTILSNLNMTIDKGDYLCIIGENGSGKSTLMKTLLGLLSPVKGNITFTEAGSCIGYLPQQTDIQMGFPASVDEVVMSGCLNHCGFFPSSKKDRALTDKNMEELDILPLKNRCFRELSGGQRQRVLLARALCATKDVLLLDEPVAGLDPSATALMYEIIEKLHKKGMTIIMISHDIDTAIPFADHILQIGSHRPLFFGTKDDYIKSDIGKSYLLQAKADSVDIQEGDVLDA